MTSIDDLVALRQSSLDTFVVNGGKRRDASYIGEQEAEPFVTDVALLTHPLYSTVIKNNATAIQRSLESTIAKITNSRMITDAVQLSKVHYYGSRDNKYGTSCISFDNEGVLFACGGSNGIIKVYDFDECYASSCLRRDGITVSPVVSFDTRRDVTCISWSHLRPDYVAVSYLFRPDIQVFDLTDAEDGTCDPRQTLTADGKGRGGHNVLLYWHSAKSTPPLSSGAQEKVVGELRHTEGIVAGSVTGFIRYWSSAGGSKSCAWNVMADPQRTSLTATPVVALQALHLSASCSDGATPQLLLAATAQGVVVLWDLSDLRAASFGSVQPEPRCVRRIELTSQLLLYESRTLIGVTPTQYPFCSACSAKKENNNGNSRRQFAGTHSDTSCHNIDVLSCSHFRAKPARPSAPAPAASSHQVDSTVLLTVSQGCVYVLDLNTETVVLSSAGSSGATYESAGAQPQQAATSKLQSGIDPANPTVLSYEQLRQELATAEQTSRDQGGHTLRAVLPAVVPAWNSHQHLQQFNHTDGSLPSRQHLTLLAKLTEGAASDRPAGDVAIVAVPRRGSDGTVLSAYDLADSAPLQMFPNSHNLNGLCSVSGKDSDPYSGVVRSNMRRTDAAATTLPGFIMGAEPGSHEVVTSTDLQTYLCASVASGGGSVFAKSSEVEFDWTFQGLDLLAPCLPATSSSGSNGALETVHTNGMPYLRTTSTNTVEGTSLHRLILRTPYVGPCVVDGQPRVYVRAALLPSGRTATYATINSQGSSGAHRPLPLHENLAMTQAITALAAHPTFPILVAGTRTDDIVLINPCAPACAEDLVQELYPVVVATGEGEECPIVSERENRAAAALTARRTLHRVGKALPVSDAGTADRSDEIKAETSSGEPSTGSALDSALDAEMELDALPPIVSDRVSSVSKDRTEESNDNEIDDDDDCSLVQLREQYDVDASVLTEPQLRRVLAAGEGEGALMNMNSPLERARQQMLRARAKHQKVDPIGSFGERDLEMPDIAAFAGGRELSHEKSAETNDHNSTRDEDKPIVVSGLQPRSGVSESAHTSGIRVEQARSQPSSIAAIHQSHHKRDNNNSSTSCTTASAAPREVKKPSLLHMFATGSNFPASKGSTASTYVATARKNELNKAPTNLELSTTRAATASGPARNSLSKLLVPKSALPAVAAGKEGVAGPAPSSNGRTVPLVLQKSTSETIRRPSANAPQETNRTAAPMDTSITGKKRATDSSAPSAAAKVPALQPAAANSKPKSVSNILNFFSVNKK